ncbi:MAG: hypothetical protein A2287_03085 [Candidatus Melainabacteria bacterium RIFOXYA12_FULL_32_12]|nr:MAG: hypothetical protein A2287_03085 [Candidatus Melainabacteria bacterium RIFOXYA12_FULL_32_12]
MFQKNLEVLKVKNPVLASKLEKIDIANIKNIDVVNAESKDLIINYNKVNLHSSLDPIREAKTVWHRTIKTDLKVNDIQIVFGLGLGYLFKRAFVSSDSKIFLIEPFIEVLRFVLEYVDFSVEFSENRVFITDNIEDLNQKLQAEFLSGDKVEFLFLNSFAALAQDQLIKLTQTALEICESKSADQNTIFNQCKSWVKNSILNLQYYSESRPLGFFEGVFSNKTALIISAGPSLVNQVQKIKENRDKFIIIAVAPILKYLIQEGIIPDFATFTDASNLSFHIEGIEEHLSKINLVINSRAENCIIQKDFKSKIIYLSETDLAAQWFRDHTSADVGLYKSGGSVSILSYYLAKAFGCNVITFAGLDLAMVNNKIYADGQDLQCNEAGDYVIPGKVIKKLMHVKGYNGQMLPTRDDYALFIRHFEEIFRQEHNPARIINTSTSGALINGMEYMEFDDFINIIGSPSFTISQELSEVIEKTQDKWAQLNDSIYPELKNQYKKIQEIDKLAKPVISELREVCVLFEDQEINFDIIEAKISPIKDSMAQVRNDVVKNVFLSIYLQNEIWKYTRQYNTSVLPNLDDVKANMKLELEFFTSVNLAIDNIIQSMETAFLILDKKIPTVKNRVISIT